MQNTHNVNIVRWTIPACRTILSPASRGLFAKKRLKDTYSLEEPNLHFERLYSGLPLPQPFLIENSIDLELLLKLDRNIWRDTFFRTAWQLLWQPRPLLQPFDLGVSQNKNRSLWFVKQDRDIILQKSCWQKSEVIILRRGTEEALTREIDSCFEKSEGGHKDQLTCCLHLW